jgi:serine/threonine-protein kinase RsbW
MLTSAREPVQDGHASYEGGLWNSTWNHTHISYAREVVPLIDKIALAMQAVGYGAKDVYGMRLALEEAIVNGLRHGNRSDPSKRVQVRYSVRSDRVLAEVEDQGPGFQPDGVPDPAAPENLTKSSGRGLLLIRHYTTWSRYNQRGNSLTLCKRPAAPLSPPI